MDTGALSDMKKVQFVVYMDLEVVLCLLGIVGQDSIG
jgi:hypothetical protein